MRQEKLMSQLDSERFFICATRGEESPLEPGVFLIPAGAIDVDPPTVPEGKRAKWNGTWVFVDIPMSTPDPEYESIQVQ